MAGGCGLLDLDQESAEFAKYYRTLGDDRFSSCPSLPHYKSFLLSRYYEFEVTFFISLDKFFVNSN